MQHLNISYSISLLILLSLLGLSHNSFADAAPLTDSYSQWLEDMKKIQEARFAAHPDQLKDPHVCDKLIIPYDKNKDNRAASEKSYELGIICDAAVEDILQKEKKKKLTKTTECWDLESCQTVTCSPNSSQPEVESFRFVA